MCLAAIRLALAFFTKMAASPANNLFADNLPAHRTFFPVFSVNLEAVLKASRLVIAIPEIAKSSPMQLYTLLQYLLDGLA